jgi:predicted nucleic acid-binding protein
MSKSVLVDSNVFIGLLHRRVDPVVELGQWIDDGNLATCGMVRLEVERGLRSPRLKEYIGGIFDVMIFGHSSVKTWECATRLAWELDRTGRTLPSTDILIATIAMELDASVLTADAHFFHIPGLEVLHPENELPGWNPV